MASRSRRRSEAEEPEEPAEPAGAAAAAETHEIQVKRRRCDTVLEVEDDWETQVSSPLAPAALPR